ncbi:MAG: serine hydrolase, partial [Chitinophagaceae bacterium]|nr:serine hydrolase [Chitinophagaceae bacterium]
MHKLPLLLLLFAGNITCYGQASDAKANKRVDKFINATIKALGIPGMAVAVVKNGSILKMSAYGMANVEWNTKVTTHSTFQIASCTKLLTSTLLLKAIYTGKINLDDHIGTGRA